MADLNWPEVLLGLGLAAALGELTDWLPRISENTVRLAARHLPQRAQEREAEWLAMLDELPGKWGPFVFALSCLLIARASVLNALLDRLQRVFIWLARFSVVVGVPEGVRRAWVEGDLGALVAAVVLVLLLGPALGRRSFDPGWFPTWHIPRWVWRAELVVCVLVALNGLWMGDVPFVAWFGVVMAVLYGRDLARISPRPDLSAGTPGSREGRRG